MTFHLASEKGALHFSARAGYAARGLVYLTISGLALFYVLTGHGDTVGPKGAMQDVSTLPMGELLLILLSAGLIAYAIWRSAQSLLNADNHKADAKGYAVRGGLLVSGLTHCFLAIYTFQLALGSTSGGDGGSEKTIVSSLLSHAFGNYLVMLAGGTLACAGLAQMWKGASGKFDDWLDMPSRYKTGLKFISAAGLIMRGVLFMILGGFIIYAGITYDPGKAGGVQEALLWVREQPYGNALFTFMALGLFAFSIYSFIEAGCRKFVS